MDAALAAVIKKVNKAHGEGTILLGRDVANEVVPRITTGSLSLDVALGGGWAANQWNEVVGNESHGKTALVLRTIAANQERDPNWTVVWCAAEQFVPAYAQMIGVDLDRVILVEDNTMEVVYEVAIEVMKNRAADCVVIDSLPALVSIREDEKTMEDLQPGQAAFLTGKFFRKSSSAIKRSLIEDDRPCTGLIINQWREKIGVTHGDPRTTPGGLAKNFYYFIRVEARRTEWITNTKQEKIGQTIAVRNMKNKTAPPGAVGFTDFYFAKGGGHQPGEFDSLKEIINVGIDFGVIQRKGAWYVIGESQWQGKEALTEAIRADERLVEKVTTEVMEKIKLEPAEVDGPED